MGSDLINVEIRCTHCMRKERAKVRSGVPTHDLPLPQGWEQVVVSDPIRGTELVRQWEATLCPECAAIEATTDAGPYGNERSEG